MDQDKQGARSETGNVNISSSTSRKKNKKNGKIYIMKWKTNNNTLLEQFQNQIELSQKEAASILLAYIYI